MIVLDAGAEDLSDDGEVWEITGPPSALEGLKAALARNKLEPISAEVTYLPQNTVHVEGPQAGQVMRLVEGLDEQDDVQHVYSNFDIEEKEIEAAIAATGGE